MKVALQANFKFQQSVTTGMYKKQQRFGMSV